MQKHKKNTYDSLVYILFFQQRTVIIELLFERIQLFLLQ